MPMRHVCRRNLWRPRPQHHGCHSIQRLLSHGNETVTVSSSLDDPVSPTTVGLQEKLLKAPFQRVTTSRLPLFPWRHSPELLPRLDPTTLEFHEKRQLLGGNVYTSYPLVDELATAWMFMNVPWHQMIFFRHWQADLAENMSWAFVQGVAGILSNVYQGRSCLHSNADDQCVISFETRHLLNESCPLIGSSYR